MTSSLTTKFHAVAAACLSTCAAWNASAQELTLTAAEQQKVLAALMQPSSGVPAVTYEILNAAALRTLMAEHPAGVEFIRGSPVAPVPWKTVAVRVPGGPGYFRPGSYAAADAPAWRTAVVRLVKEGAQSLILDLRAPAADGAGIDAAVLAGIFMPSGRDVLVASEPVKSSGAQVFTGRLAVLVDLNTGNVGEVLAGILHTHRAAFLMGATTRGRAADFAEISIREAPESLTLRYPLCRWQVLGGVDFFGKGLPPDLSLPGTEKPNAALEKVLAAEGAAAAVTAPTWPRMNEAALIDKSIPELAWRIKAPEPPPPVDPVMIAALDILRADRLLPVPPAK